MNTAKRGAQDGCVGLPPLAKCLKNIPEHRDEGCSILIQLNCSLEEDPRYIFGLVQFATTHLAVLTPDSEFRDPSWQGLGN